MYPSFLRFLRSTVTAGISVVFFFFCHARTQRNTLKLFLCKQSAASFKRHFSVSIFVLVVFRSLLYVIQHVALAAPVERKIFITEARSFCNHRVLFATVIFYRCTESLLISEIRPTRCCCAARTRNTRYER